MAIAVLLAVAIVLPPFINVNRYRLDVANAMGRALGRQVTVGGIGMRLFPEPGFLLDNVVVADDPSINAEPLLRAGEVRASLRITSLWRGRLEISKLSLTDPSLNLVRAPDGRWNLQSLLYKVAQTPSAPTAKSRPEARPRFPYIEADGGRINLKLGVEKTVYALTDAQFALWLQSENQWQVRLQARAVRTDANLGDTGDLRLEGSLGRGDRLGTTPLDLRLRLDDAQLGQLTDLFYGRDRGWRGTVALDAQFRGTPEQMQASATARVDDFRRYDIISGGALRLAARCQGGVSLTRQQLTSVRCEGPVANGVVIVAGDLDGFFVRRGYRVDVAVENLPASNAVVLVRHMKRDLPPDLDAGGRIDAGFALRRSPDQSPVWSGSGSATGLQLRSARLDEPLSLGDVKFALLTDKESPPKPTYALRGLRAPVAVVAERRFLQVAPFPVRIGGSAPAMAQARFSRLGYVLQLQGDADLDNLMQLAQATGLAAPQTVAGGPAHLDLQVAGEWTGFAAPQVTGAAQLRNDTARVPGLAKPLEIAAATITMSDQDVRVENLSASFTGMGSTITGRFGWLRHCTSDFCPVEFQLKADQLSSDDLNRLINPRLRPRPWYQMIGLSSGPEHSPLASLEAQGQISVARLAVKSVVASKVSADVGVNRGTVSLINISAELLGGTHQGEWRADFTGATPSYAGHGTVQGVILARVGAILDEDFASGKANANYSASASGWNLDGLVRSAAATVSFDWRDGTLSRVALGDGHTPLRFRRFAGQLQLHDATLQFAPSRMEAADGIYSVSGTASLDRQLGLHLARNGTLLYDVTGTLAKPRVARVAPAQTATASAP